MILAINPIFFTCLCYHVSLYPNFFSPLSSGLHKLVLLTGTEKLHLFIESINLFYIKFTHCCKI